MIRLSLSVAAVAMMFVVHSQPHSTNYLPYTGKYEANGFVIQILVRDQRLMLGVPGAPLQPLTPVSKHKFRSTAFDDEHFLFVEENGKFQRMISQSPNNASEFKRIADKPDDFNSADSILTGKKTSTNFIFLYNESDSVSVRYIASILQTNYDRILSDFKLMAMSQITVRIYPTVGSFHVGINFPNAPLNILATAFGKDDFRMLSPSLSNVDSLELARHVLHEFTHCVHLNVNYSPNNPRWLWEGVAMYESGWFVDPKSIDVIRSKQYPPFASLNNGLEYELGYCIIKAIKDIWGFDTVVRLIQKKGNVPEVLQISQREFEKKIYESIGSK